MESKKLLLVLLLMVFLGSFVLPEIGYASDMTSGSFEVLAPVFHSNGFASSPNFRLFGSLGQAFQGVSNSGTFQLKQGFQYYAPPVAAATPTPTPIPGPTGSGGGPILEIYKHLFNLLFCDKKSGDLNCDGQVDLVDAAILFYWWGQPLQQPQAASALTALLNSGRPSPDLNTDSSVDIFDLSILLSNWTD